MLHKEQYKQLRYFISFPESYRPGDRYPVLFHTHGAGGRGDDLDKMNINAICHNNPCREQFIIVAPQCYADTWFEIFEQLIDFCDYIRQREFTDQTRFYSTGISMGGYAAWQLLMSRPEWFAAAVICCGGGMYWNAKRLKGIPIRAYHGTDDKTVFPEESKKMVSAAGESAELVLLEGVGHNCWDAAFTDPKNYEWLLSHRKILPET